MLKKNIKYMTGILMTTVLLSACGRSENDSATFEVTDNYASGDGLDLD